MKKSPVTLGKGWSFQIIALPCGGFCVTDGYRQHDPQTYQFASSSVDEALAWIKASLSSEPRR